MPIDLPDSKAPSAAVIGGVEIVGFPHLLLTRSFGAPDALLLPVLDGAREALAATKGFTAAGQSESQASMMAGIHVATALLKNSHFTLASKGSQTQNHYILDLAAQTIHLRTWLFATVDKHTSSFLVTIAGNIQTGQFVVRSGADDSTISEFDEQRVRLPEFFSTTLPKECLRHKLSKDHFKRFGDLPIANGDAGVRINVTLSSGIVPILLRKKEKTDTWEVIDENTSARVSELPPEAATHLEYVLKSLPELFNRGPKAGK